MEHEWSCKRCGAKWHSYCFERIWHENRWVDAYELISHRRRMEAMLCDTCFAEFEKNPDPVFELCFKLAEKINELRRIESSLKYLYEDQLDKVGVEKVRYEKWKVDVRKHRIEAGMTPEPEWF